MNTTMVTGLKTVPRVTQIIKLCPDELTVELISIVWGNPRHSKSNIETNSSPRFNPWIRLHTSSTVCNHGHQSWLWSFLFSTYVLCLQICLSPLLQHCWPMLVSGTQLFNCFQLIYFNCFLYKLLISQKSVPSLCRIMLLSTVSQIQTFVDTSNPLKQIY